MDSISNNTSHDTVPTSSAAASGAAFSGEQSTPATDAALVDILDFPDDKVDIMAEFGDIIHDIYEAPPSDFLPQPGPHILASGPVRDLSEMACPQVTSATRDHVSRRIGGDEGQRPDQLNKKMLKPKRTTTKPPRAPRESIVTHLSHADMLDDGFRWIKYGQKELLHSPYPRSYYRCTSAGCGARKTIERSCHDPLMIETRYVGSMHTHYYPAPFGHSTAGFYPGTSSAGFYPGTSSAGGSSTAGSFSSGGSSTRFGIANAVGGGGGLLMIHGGGTGLAYNVGQYQQGQPPYTSYNNMSLPLPLYNYGVADDATTTGASIGLGSVSRGLE